MNDKLLLPVRAAATPGEPDASRDQPAAVDRDARQTYATAPADVTRSYNCVWSASTGGSTSDASSDATSAGDSTSASGMSDGTTAATTTDATSTSGESNTATGSTSEGSTGELTATTTGCVPVPEVCDQADNDCDDLVDEGSPDNLDCDGCQFALSADGTKYFAVCSDNASWDAARMACQSFGPGADLAVIDSADDQTTVNAMTSADHWIGLSDSANDAIPYVCQHPA